MARFLCAAALLLLALTAVSANSPGCADKVTGYSPFFGVKGATKALAYKDQLPMWKEKGQITKINVYYSWNHKCLQGFKVTYGWDSKDSAIIGQDLKGLSTVDLKLNAYEHVVKAEIKQDGDKCITWIKLYTNGTKTLSIGDTKSTLPSVTASAKGGKGAFLAAVRGYDTKAVVGGKEVSADLQQLQFVWAMEECAAAEVPKPKPPPPENKVPTEGPPEPAPAPPAPLCKAVPEMCDTGVDLGVASFCPFVNPFTKSVCMGGCCKSAGKCKAPFCSLAGLGADIMTLDFICFGKNDGPFGGLNKCKNLGCKLAVPGCVSDVLGGSCLGTVAAMADDVDADAKKYLGMPCLESTKSLLPFDKLGMFKNGGKKGEYVSGLWTVCDCNADNPRLPTLPQLSLPDLGDLKKCKGPLCALVPKLPELNCSLPDLQIPFTLLQNLTSMLADAAKPQMPNISLSDLKDLITISKPNISIPQIDLSNLVMPSLPKFPTKDDMQQIFDSISTVVGAVSDGLGGLKTAMPNPSDAIAQLLASIPSLAKPFELPNFDLADLAAKLPNFTMPAMPNITMPDLPKKSMPTLPTLDLSKLDLANLTAKLGLDLSKLDLSKLDLANLTAKLG